MNSIGRHCIMDHSLTLMGVGQPLYKYEQLTNNKNLNAHNKASAPVLTCRDVRDT